MQSYFKSPYYLYPSSPTVLNSLTPYIFSGAWPLLLSSAVLRSPRLLLPIKWSSIVASGDTADKQTDRVVWMHLEVCYPLSYLLLFSLLQLADSDRLILKLPPTHVQKGILLCCHRDRKLHLTLRRHPGRKRQLEDRSVKLDY